MGAFIDLTGQQFNNWIVIEYNKEARKWLCECQCKNHTRKLIASADLRKGKSTNCGCMRKKELTGKQFGHLIVDSYAEDYHWNCHCIECGKKFVVHTYHLEHNNIPNCTHSDLHTNVKDINGQIFGQWKVLSYAGNKYWNCECQCELHTRRKILGKDLRSGRSKSCGLDKPGVVALMNSDNKFIDLKGQTFGDWKVIEYVGNGFWKCECQCEKHTIKNVKGTALREGSTKSCGHKSGVLNDISGQKFGELTAKRYIGNGIWECKCSCENIVNVDGYSLRSGHTKSCGSSIHHYKDIKGQKFWSLTAIEYLGKGLWKWKCDCKNIRVHTRADVESGRIKSCGCKHSEYRDVSMTQLGIYKDRTYEQKEAVKSRDNMIKFIGNEKITVNKLAEKLNINNNYASSLCIKYDLYDKYVLKDTGKSGLEEELYEYIKSIYNGEILRNNRLVLQGMELDIYLPEIKTAFEFNGTYWHSDEKKAPKYHQQKTIACAQKGIRLIHIFEYEWIDNIKQEKIKNYLRTLLCNNELEKLYARSLNIKEVDTNEKELFEEKYHLQSSSKSNIAIGLYNGNELVGLMTFGKPRFNNNFQYEIIRMCYKDNIIIVGGTERLFKYFIKNYKPQSIITYCDIAKFTGKSYLKLGFITNTNKITSPNYVWVSSNRDKVIPRYKTQKQKLLKLGLGTEKQTEDEIMKSLGFIKVYDCGNLKFEWYAK